MPDLNPAGLLRVIQSERFQVLGYGSIPAYQSLLYIESRQNRGKPFRNTSQPEDGVLIYRIGLPFLFYAKSFLIYNPALFHDSNRSPRNTPAV